MKAAWTKVYKGIFEALKVWTWSIVEMSLEAALNSSPYSLCQARAECFPYVSSLNAKNSPMKYVLLSLFYRGGTEAQKLNNLPKTLQLVNGRAGSQI